MGTRIHQQTQHHARRLPYLIAHISAIKQRAVISIQVKMALHIATLTIRLMLPNRSVLRTYPTISHSYQQSPVAAASPPEFILGRELQMVCSCLILLDHAKEQSKPVGLISGLQQNTSGYSIAPTSQEYSASSNLGYYNNQTVSTSSGKSIDLEQCKFIGGYIVTNN